jgi:two-component system phosphate regulon response regulator OmpR
VPDVEFVRFGAFTFHLERGELKRGGTPVRITDRERDMLRMFAGRAGETIRRHEFLKVSNGGGERAVDVQINRLRRKIEQDPSNPVYLQTTRGIGYRLLVD